MDVVLVSRVSVVMVISPSLLAGRQARLLYREQLHVKDQRGVRWYTRPSGFTIRQRGRNDQPTLAARLHRREPFVPTTDHLACAEHELERSATRLQRAVK